MKVRPIDGDLEQLLDEVRDKRDRLQEHLTVYQSLFVRFEPAGKSEYDQVLKDE